MMNELQYLINRSILLTDEMEETTANIITSSAVDNDVDMFVYRVITIAIIVGLTAAALFILRKIFKKYYAKAEADGTPIKKERVTTARVVHSIIRFVILLIAGFGILATLGVDVTALVAALGIVGAIGAIAVQDLIKDFLSGTNIASEQYFAIGDVVEFEGIIGTVTSLTMRSTKIQTIDGSVVSMQNHIISKIRKVSRENKVLIPLSYDVDRERAYAVCGKIAKKISDLPNVDRCITSGIEAFSDSSIDYALLFYCDPMKMYSAKRMANVEIINTLDSEGIEIPYGRIEIVNLDTPNTQSCPSK